LRQLRVQARLTQEELAEAAGISTRAVSDLERGVNQTAQKETARLLAGALGLDGRAAEVFVAAARGRAPAGEVLAARPGADAGTFAAAATRALPRDTGSFTGRRAELAGLLGVVDATAASGGVVGIHAIDGMAGIGKTTLAVHAAHQMAERFPDGQFFVPLHAHTPGHRPVDPADALASLLVTAGVAAQLIPPGLEARAARWRDQVAGKKVLLLLDDAASHDQVAPLLPGSAGSLVLVTSRRRLAALQDAAVISLGTLAPQEAAALVARLAGRPDICAEDAAVAEITGLCGYLPLAISMLASQLRHHPTWTPAGLAADLAQAADRLSVMRAENVSVAAAFDLSYQDLTPGQQRLFRRLGLVPGPTIDAYAAAALDGTSLKETRSRLDGLYDQQLLTEPAPGRYLLHDLLREHGRALAAADDPAESAAATGRLLDYYLHTAAAANQLTARRPPAASPPMACPPPAVPNMASKKDAETWLDAERANLLSAAGHAAASGLAIHAVWIPAQLSDFLATHGYLDEAIALHQTAVGIAESAGDRAGQAAALRQLGFVIGARGEYPAAIRALTAALGLYRDLGDRLGQVDVCTYLGHVQNSIDEYATAAQAATEALVLSRAEGDRLGEADSLFALSAAQQGVGDDRAATTSVNDALALYRDLGDQLGQAVTLTSTGVLLQQAGHYQRAVHALTEALAVCRDLGDPVYIMIALLRLGTTQRLAGDYQAAATSLDQGLALARQMGMLHGRAEALTELGALRYLTGDYQAAATFLTQGLDLYREVGDRASQAGALNHLGALQAATLGPEDGLARYAEALTIAHDAGAPLEEADALAGMGRCHLQAGDTPAGAALLRQALDIYQRLGSPSAQGVQEVLNKHPT
jgi:tetratricopeptide (TPR) repeat protein/transcriptional regulator with XRE-family HTH domain